MSSPATFSPEMVAHFRALAWKGEPVAPAARTRGIRPNTMSKAVRGESKRWAGPILGIPAYPAHNTEPRTYTWDQAQGQYALQTPTTERN